MTKPLIQFDPSGADEGWVSDAWALAAWNVEVSLMRAGAEPGRDYSMLDLYRLAQPFVLQSYQAGKLTFYRESLGH